jgi:hypothetical protein
MDHSLFHVVFLFYAAVRRCGLSPLFERFLIILIMVQRSN